jgi:hypothetical protein
MAETLRRFVLMTECDETSRQLELLTSEPEAEGSADESRTKAAVVDDRVAEKASHSTAQACQFAENDVAMFSLPVRRYC